VGRSSIRDRALSQSACAGMDNLSNQMNAMVVSAGRAQSLATQCLPVQELTFLT